MQLETYAFFEKVFYKSFNDRKPLFLTNLELCGYNKELKLAFIFEGSQIIYRQQKVKILVIPSKLSVEEREKYILDWLIRNGFSRYIIRYYKLERIRQQLLLCTIQDLKEIGEEMKIPVTARYRDDIIQELCCGLASK
jgi:hypothetical protein